MARLLSAPLHHYPLKWRQQQPFPTTPLPISWEPICLDKDTCWKILHLLSSFPLQDQSLLVGLLQGDPFWEETESGYHRIPWMNPQELLLSETEREIKTFKCLNKKLSSMGQPGYSPSFCPMMWNPRSIDWLVILPNLLRSALFFLPLQFLISTHMIFILFYFFPLSIKTNISGAK